MNGNVGIGTWSPQSLFHVSKSGAAGHLRALTGSSNDFSFYWSNEANPRYTINPNLTPSSLSGIGFGNGGSSTIAALGVAVGYAAARTLAFIPPMEQH